MQLFRESTSGISVKLNAAALPEHSEPIADTTLRSVQEFRDRSQLLVSSKIEQSPVIIFGPRTTITRSEEHTSELQSRPHLVCRLLLEKQQQWRCTARQTT